MTFMKTWSMRANKEHWTPIYSPSFAGDKRVREVKLTDIRRPLSRTRANGGGFKLMTLTASRLPLSGDLKNGTAAALSMLAFSWISLRLLRAVQIQTK